MMTSCDIMNNSLFKQINLTSDHCFIGTDFIDQNMFFFESMPDKSPTPIHQGLEIEKDQKLHFIHSFKLTQIVTY